MTSEQFQRNKARAEEEDRQLRFSKHVREIKENGERVVGIVTRVRCSRCKQPRWADGTACRYPMSVEAVKGNIQAVPCGCRTTLEDQVIGEEESHS
jgi:hypothetical protein